MSHLLSPSHIRSLSHLIYIYILVSLLSVIVVPFYFFFLGLHTNGFRINWLGSGYRFVFFLNGFANAYHNPMVYAFRSDIFKQIQIWITPDRPKPDQAGLYLGNDPFLITV